MTVITEVRVVITVMMLVMRKEQWSNFYVIPNDMVSDSATTSKSTHGNLTFFCLFPVSTSLVYTSSSEILALFLLLIRFPWLS